MCDVESRQSWEWDVKLMPFKNWLRAMETKTGDDWESLQAAHFIYGGIDFANDPL